MKDFKFPFALDKNTGKSSVTLFFVYVAFFLALGAICSLLNHDVLSGTVAAITLFFGCYVLYKMRQLDKFKIDLEHRSIEAEDTPDVPVTTVTTTTEVKNEPAN